MISCDCSVDWYDPPDNYITFHTIDNLDEHVCCECNETIKKGELREHSEIIYYEGEDDQQEYEYDTCIPCVGIRKRYCPNGYIFGELRSTIQDCLGFDYLEDPKDMIIDD